MITNFAKFGCVRVSMHSFICSNPTPPTSEFAFNWTPFNESQLNYLRITDSPVMDVGYHWRGHVFWNLFVTLLWP